MDETLKKIATNSLSRRGFLASAGVASAATLIGCGDSTPVTSTLPTAPAAVPVSDIDILNFALNLEYLETEFYLRAVTGSGIPAADGGGASVTIKSGKVSFSNTFFQQFAFEIAQTELQHVRAIRATITALGGTPIAAPALNYTDAFNNVAFQAGLTSFDPFASDYNYLVGALAFEEVGVSAYTGAAKLISATAVLDAAAGIQAAESYHAGAIRTILAGNSISSGSTANLNAYNSILQLFNKLDPNNHVTLLTAGGATTGSTVVTADTTNAIAYARTTDQVLHIAYGTMPGTYTASGGFFPGGLNGNIKAPTT
ncbi:MAG: ferritin-like domain-containing protein [Janthinobacterium lividum]